MSGGGHGGGGGEDEIPEPAVVHLPHWFVSFADLMSLLMSFFVLLLSFSQQDGAKFKQVAGSMDKAFGVQREIPVMEIPRGTSIIAKEFSPGRPEPTPLNEVKQSTTRDYENTLDFDKGKGGNDAGGIGLKDNTAEKPQGMGGEKGSEQSKNLAFQMAKDMSDEILKGNVEIEVVGSRVIIRVMEQGSFESGGAVINPESLVVFQKIRGYLEKTPGLITISGHTDNVPINTNQFRSNWDLSAARAVSVLHELTLYGGISPDRLEVVAYGETRPLFPNDSADHRRHNRRIEIEIEQGDYPKYQKPSDNLNSIPDNPAGLESTEKLLKENNPDKIMQEGLKIQPTVKQEKPDE
jgi:chemotaxis protein MotB